MSDNGSNFFIMQKKEFLNTYSTDFGNQMLIDDLWDWWNKKWGKKFEIILALEHGDRNINHNHFHMYLNWIGPTKKGFSTRTKTIWNYPLKSPVYKIYPEDVANIEGLEFDRNGYKGLNYYKYMSEDDILSLPGSYSYTNTKFMNVENGIISVFGFSEYKYMDHAQINIRFKGDKTYIVYDDKGNKHTPCQDTISMIQYVTKHPLEIRSNFDWKKRLQDLISMRDSKIGSRFNKGNEENKDNLEYNFCKWLFTLINENKHYAPTDIKKMITKEPDYFYIYSSKYNNYDTFINHCFQYREITKPKQHWDWKWCIPKVLADWLKELDEWVENWYTNKSKCQHRMKGLWLTGCSRSGKSSLAILQGPCTWFKNMWNALAYEADTPFNVMDDFDVEFEKIKDFTLFKPWVGAQDCLTMTDKWVKKLDIENGKPLIWLNNNSLMEQCPNPATRKYIRANMVVVELKQCLDDPSLDEDLYTPKDRRTIGGYCQWVDWDPKSTWYYKNMVANPNSPSANPGSDVLNASFVDFLDDLNNDVHLLPSDDDEEGRPTKRTRFN